MTAELLEQIWQRPTDRDLLRVYADWLATNGEPTRAEFMQLSLIARPTPAQTERRGALLAKHRGAWLGAARPFIHTWEDSDESPGFVASAHCSFAKLTRGFAHIRALGPRLFVTTGEPKAKRAPVELAQLPLGTLYGLGFVDYKNWISDDVLATIAPALDGLRALKLYSFGTRATEHGWSVMLPYLRALERLELWPGKNAERWVELLLEARLELEALQLPRRLLDEPLRARVVRQYAKTTFRD